MLDHQSHVMQALESLVSQRLGSAVAFHHPTEADICLSVATNLVRLKLLTNLFRLDLLRP